jgi:acetyl-CoA carboxylase carboxyltransferase component
MTKTNTGVNALTTLFTIPIPAASIYGFTAKAVVRDAADNECAFYETKFAVKLVAGVATMVGAPVVIIANSDDAGWVFTVGVSANNAIVQFDPSASGDTVGVQSEIEFIRRPV